MLYAEALANSVDAVVRLILSPSLRRPYQGSGISRRPAVARVRSQACLCEVCGGYNGITTGIPANIPVFSPVIYHSSWYLNPSRGIQIRLVVFNPSRGIQISFVLFKCVSWYLNPSRGTQIRLVVFKFDSWYSNSSRGIQIRLVVGKFVLVEFKSVCRLRLIALDSIVGNCC